MIKQSNVKYNLEVIDLKSNFGRSYARNVRLAKANGEIVSFIDSDMILPYNYIWEHNNRAIMLPNAVFVGFYQNIESIEYDVLIKRLEKKKFVFNADFHTDSRYQKIFTEDNLKWNYNLTREDMTDFDKGKLEVLQYVNSRVNLS